MSSKPPKPGSRRARSRDRLIVAAREAIGERGFHRTTLDEIAARAGLTKGAIYDSFASKEDLFLAVVVAWATERAERFAWPTDTTGPLKERLRRLAEASNADAPEAMREAPLRAEFLLYTLTHEQMRERIAEVAKMRVEKMRERLRRFIKDEELPLPIDQFIVLLEALVPGLMFLRSQSPALVTDDVVIAILEALAGPNP
jgi:AcrR family transcriptional regulator